MTEGRPHPEAALADIRTLLFMYDSILEFGRAETSIRITPAAARNFDLPARSVGASFLAQDLSRRRMHRTIATLRECYGTRAAASRSPEQRRDADEIDQLLERFQRSVRPAVAWWKLALPAALLSTFVLRINFASEHDRPAYEALLGSVAATIRLDYDSAFHPAARITALAAFQLVSALAFSLLIVVVPFMWRNYPHYRALFLVDWTSDKNFLNHERCATALEHRAAMAVGQRRAPAWWDFQVDLVLKLVGATTFVGLLAYFWTLPGEYPLTDTLASAAVVVLVAGPIWWWYVVRLSRRMAARRDNRPNGPPGFLSSLGHARSLRVWCFMAFVLLVTSEVVRGRASIIDTVGKAAVCVTWVWILQGAAWVVDVGWPRARMWVRHP